MTAEMRKQLALLSYEEKLQRVAELIEFSRKFKAPTTSRNAQAETGASGQNHASPYQHPTDDRHRA